MTLESLCRVTCNGLRGERVMSIREIEVSKSKLREAEGRGLEVTLNTNGIWVELITVLCKCNDSILIIAKWGPQNSTHKRVGPVGQKCVIPCGRHAMPCQLSPHLWFKLLAHSILNTFAHFGRSKCSRISN